MLRMAHHGMTLQQAIDAPAFHTTHVPSTFAPPRRWGGRAWAARAPGDPCGPVVAGPSQRRRPRPRVRFLFAGANPRGQAATAQFLAERKLTAAPPDFDAQDLFEFYHERCLWTQTSCHGDWNPRHTIWRPG